jgi:hypothetical protein
MLAEMGLQANEGADGSAFNIQGIAERLGVPGGKSWVQQREEYAGKKENPFINDEERAKRKIRAAVAPTP